MDTESPLSKPAVPATETGASELQQQVASLRRLLLITLLIIVGATFPLNIYLMSQVRHVTRERDRLREQRPQFEQAIAQYQNTAQPLIENLIRDLNSYSKARPQVAPLLQKYRITPPSAQTGNSSAGETAQPGAGTNQ